MSPKAVSDSLGSEYQWLDQENAPGNLGGSGNGIDQDKMEFLGGPHINLIPMLHPEV